MPPPEASRCIELSRANNNKLVVSRGKKVKRNRGERSVLVSLGVSGQSSYRVRSIHAHRGGRGRDGGTVKKCAVTSNKVPLSKPKPWTRSPSVLTWKSSKDDTAARLPQPLDRSRWTGCSEQWTYSKRYRVTRHRCAAFSYARRWTQVLYNPLDLRSVFLYLSF